ncbi:MAG TPA: hypothetical protein VMU50_13050 [Polyangia bacterium]|nr:hypothetical protein [Polyangia bacterium]
MRRPIAPRRLAPLAAIAWVAAWTWVAAPACTYAPDFDNGRLLCGAKGSCPKGYHCEAGHTCYKDGTTLNGSGGASGSGGSAGGTGGKSGGSITTRNDLVGSWIFTSGTLNVACSDNTSKTKPLGASDHVDVALGSGTGITADFYCDWNLDLSIDGGGASTNLPSGQTCMSTSGCSDFTWMGQSFDFSADNTATGMLDAKINATYKDYTDPLTATAATPACLPKATTPNPATGTCMLTISGALAKQ